MQPIDILRKLRRTDQRRDGVPGEHWATFGTSLAVFQWASGRRSKGLRLLGMTAAGLLLLRALSGRDGPLARMRRTPERTIEH